MQAQSTVGVTGGATGAGTGAPVTQQGAGAAVTTSKPSVSDGRGSKWIFCHLLLTNKCLSARVFRQLRLAYDFLFRFLLTFAKCTRFTLLSVSLDCVNYKIFFVNRAPKW